MIAIQEKKTGCSWGFGIVRMKDDKESTLEKANCLKTPRTCELYLICRERTLY